jgi:phage tail P2-like protein
MATGWQAGRPIHDRLPGALEAYRKDQDWDGYNPTQDPPIADWLTVPWDELLMATKAKVDGIPATLLNPLTAAPSNLDWLAQLCGFTGDYWDASWPVAIKRQLIGRSLSFIWESKGTRALLEWLLNLFALEASIYQIGSWRAGVSKVGDPIGSAEEHLRYMLIVPLAYRRTSPEWQLVERLNRLYAPVYCESRICYDHWYAGVSAVGDPIL